jgi:hypothetical protein
MRALCLAPSAWSAWRSKSTPGVSDLSCDCSQGQPAKVEQSDSDAALCNALSISRQAQRRRGVQAHVIRCNICPQNSVFCMFYAQHGARLAGVRAGPQHDAGAYGDCRVIAHCADRIIYMYLSWTVKDSQRMSFDVLKCHLGRGRGRRRTIGMLTHTSCPRKKLRRRERVCAIIRPWKAAPGNTTRTPA